MVDAGSSRARSAPGERHLSRALRRMAAGACGATLVVACNGSSSAPPFGGSGPVDAAPASGDDGPQPEARAATPSDGASSAFAVPEGAAPSGCQPGRYTGQYTGTFQTVVPTTGPVTITLATSTVSVGENELVTNGGTWDTTWGPSAGDASLPLEEGHAELVGQLDCTADTFTAMGQNAYFTILGVDAGGFTLSLTGTYDPATATISGMFTYASSDGDGGGTWQVTLSD